MIRIEWHPRPYMGNWLEVFTIRDGQKVNLKSDVESEVFKTDPPFTVYHSAWKKEPYPVEVKEDGSVVSQDKHFSHREKRIGFNAHRCTDLWAESFDPPALGERLEIWLAGGFLVVRNDGGEGPLAK